MLVSSIEETDVDFFKFGVLGRDVDDTAANSLAGLNGRVKVLELLCFKLGPQQVLHDFELLLQHVGPLCWCEIEEVVRFIIQHGLNLEIA